MSLILTLLSLRQVDYHDFEVRPDYMNEFQASLEQSGLCLTTNVDIL